nr:hypothetical protein BaRGS_004305 [Batillaria attramentaria]
MRGRFFIQWLILFSVHLVLLFIAWKIVFKTHEEIRNVERQMDRLRESLARNENKDRNMAAQVRSRLSEQEAYLASLKSSSTALEKHQRKRTDNKKLTIF